MAIVGVSATDTGIDTRHWSVPPDPKLIDSPIPRGIRNYGGTVAVPALGAGDETSVFINFLFPSAFVYLAKAFTCNFISDDVTSEFGNIGSLEYRPGGVSSLGVRLGYQIKSDGQSFPGGARSNQIYYPQGLWRHWINGPEGDTFNFNIQDMSGDASTAGDVAWTGEFWEYDVEQCLRWPVNSPIPTINY